MIQMVVCDLDGTLLDAHGRPRPQSARILADLSAKGIIVALATGRSWRTALSIARQTRIHGPIVAHNGAYAFWPDTGQELYRRPVPAARARQMIAWADARQVMLRCYLGYGRPVLFNRFDAHHQLCWLRPEDRLWPHLARALDDDPVEVFLSGTQNADAFMAAFGPRGPDYEALVFPHPGYREVNVCAPGIDKVDALQDLVRRLHIHPKNVLGLGDGLNDVQMLSWAGYGVAMGHGCPEARAVADFITPPGHMEPVYAGIRWAIAAGLLPPVGDIKQAAG